MKRFRAKIGPRPTLEPKRKGSGLSNPVSTKRTDQETPRVSFANLLVCFTHGDLEYIPEAHWQEFLAEQDKLREAIKNRVDRPAPPERALEPAAGPVTHGESSPPAQ